MKFGSYQTIDGKRINLEKLDDKQRKFLGRLFKMFEANEAYPNLFNCIHSIGSPALLGGEWVTDEVAAHPLYQVCQDLADRLGINQGYLNENDSSGVEKAGIIEADDLLSVTEASKLAGVTPQAIRKAISENRLEAKMVGSSYTIRRSAVVEYLRSRLHRGKRGKLLKAVCAKR